MAFSSYTQVTKVTDLADVNAGIEEIKAYFQKQVEAGKKPSKKSYIRFTRLCKKQRSLEMQEMESKIGKQVKVTIKDKNKRITNLLKGTVIAMESSRAKIETRQNGVRWYNLANVQF